MQRRPRIRETPEVEVVEVDDEVDYDSQVSVEFLGDVPGQITQREVDSSTVSRRRKRSDSPPMLSVRTRQRGDSPPASSTFARRSVSPNDNNHRVMSVQERREVAFELHSRHVMSAQERRDLPSEMGVASRKRARTGPLPEDKMTQAQFNQWAANLQSGPPAFKSLELYIKRIPFLHAQRADGTHLFTPRMGDPVNGNMIKFYEGLLAAFPHQYYRGQTPCGECKERCVPCVFEVGRASNCLTCRVHKASCSKSRNLRTAQVRHAGEERHIQERHTAEGRRSVEHHPAEERRRHRFSLDAVWHCTIA